MFADFELRAHRERRGRPSDHRRGAAGNLPRSPRRAFFARRLDDQEWYRNTWARIPHFYGSPYYVFQYATSKAAASLVHRRMTDGDEAERAATVEAYLELLRSGGNDHPIAQLQKAGVDFTTTEPTEALVAEMDELGRHGSKRNSKSSILNFEF